MHIPRTRIADHFHPILRQILLPSPTFLNVTSNEIELSIFAEHHTLQEFQLAAKHDALVKPTSRERLSSGDRRRSISKDDWEPIEVSQERWNVLQIDSHADGLGKYYDQLIVRTGCLLMPISHPRLDTSGARVHELSAPLAAAGISILYQSSYMSDFIFVSTSQRSLSLLRPHYTAYLYAR